MQASNGWCFRVPLHLHCFYGLNGSAVSTFRLATRKTVSSGSMDSATTSVPDSSPGEDAVTVKAVGTEGALPRAMRLDSGPSCVSHEKRTSNQPTAHKNRGDDSERKCGILTPASGLTSCSRLRSSAEPVAFKVTPTTARASP